MSYDQSHAVNTLAYHNGLGEYNKQIKSQQIGETDPKRGKTVSIGCVF